MGITDVTPAPVAVAAAAPSGADVAPEAVPAWIASTWVRLALVCALLAASGAARLRQSAHVGAILEQGRHSPFPLSDLPLTLGPWKGQQTTMDPIIARSAGAVDNVFRRYVNQMTGATVDVILLFGPTTDMFIHSPEKCYPVAGYSLAEEGRDRMIPTGQGDAKAPFRSLVYVKGDEGRPDRQEVYFSWRFRDTWSPDVGTHKQFERIPGMFKVHLARPVSPRERRDVDNPCESLLNYLLPEFERRIIAAQGGSGAPAGGPAPVASPPSP